MELSAPSAPRLLTAVHAEHRPQTTDHKASDHMHGRAEGSGGTIECQLLPACQLAPASLQTTDHKTSDHLTFARSPPCRDIPEPLPGLAGDGSCPCGSGEGLGWGRRQQISGKSEAPVGPGWLVPGRPIAASTNIPSRAISPFREAEGEVGGGFPGGPANHDIL